MMLGSKSLAMRTNFLVVVVVAFYLLSQLIVQVALGQDWIEKNLYLILILIQILIIFLPALWFAIKQKLKPVSFIQVRPIAWSEVLLIIVMAVSASFIASVLNSAVLFFLEKAWSVQSNSIPVPKTIPELWTQILVIAVLPALCEEFFFRGILYRALEGLGTAKAIVVSAIYFALFHFDIRNLLGPLFLGILIAWYCYRTGSIFAGVLAHFTNNLLAILTSWFNRDMAADPMVLTKDTMGQLFMLACFLGVILAILIKAFQAMTRKKVKKEERSERSLSLSIMIHWPVCFFYGIYIVITAFILLR